MSKKIKSTKKVNKEKRTCVKCKKEFLISEGVLLLRGITFSCQKCYKLEKTKNKSKEVCEFC